MAHGDLDDESVGQFLQCEPSKAARVSRFCRPIGGDQQTNTAIKNYRSIDSLFTDR
jgi:hypothetical protein